MRDKLILARNPCVNTGPAVGRRFAEGLFLVLNARMWRTCERRMHVLCIIDPLDTLNLTTDTSLLLMEELARRGHVSSVATLTDLYLTGEGAGVRSHSISLDLERTPFYTTGAAVDRAWSEFDLILFRKDPPVDERYIMATFILERVAQRVPVINDPLSLRTVNEKLLPLQFPAFTPPTLVTNDRDRLTRFADEYERIILKPLTDCSGRGIRIVERHAAAPAIAAYLAEQRDGFVLAQRFLPGVAHGDKRIFLLAGAPIGAVNRVPQHPDHLANIHQGARVEATTLTSREHEIIAALAPVLRQRRLLLAGIDVIDGYLTEVNITSPSAARQINQVSGAHIEVPIVDFLERLVDRAS